MDSAREACSICGRDVGVKILDAIIDNEIKKVCEFCAAVDNSIVLIEKPTAEQLKEAERPFTVYERLRRAARLKMHEDELALREAERKREAQINLTKLAAVKNDEQFMKEQEERQRLNLASDFHEQIQHTRNLKELSQKQLADAIAETEDTIRILERGIMPQNAETVIKKIEQYLRIDLRKKPPANETVIDFKSPSMKIGDIRKMREEMFGRKTDAETISEKDENDENI